MNDIDITQLIFSPDDVSGTCYEHSTAEGIALVQVIEKALEVMKRDREVVGEAPECTTESAPPKAVEWPQPEKLTWKIDAAVCKAIEAATVSMDKWGEHSLILQTDNLFSQYANLHNSASSFYYSLSLLIQFINLC